MIKETFIIFIMPVLSLLCHERIISPNTKNKTLKGLLSRNQTTKDERNQFKLGLDYSFIDKIKHVKKNLAANFQSLADKVAC